jgi:hypothetical protein
MFLGQGRGHWGLLFNEHRASVWNNEKILEMDRIGCMTLQMSSMLLKNAVNALKMVSLVSHITIIK